MPRVPTSRLEASCPSLPTPSSSGGSRHRTLRPPIPVLGGSRRSYPSPPRGSRRRALSLPTEISPWRIEASCPSLQRIEASCLESPPRGLRRRAPHSPPHPPSEARGIVP
ncbi:hypothetical protein KY285_000855 [Solanum tuberosum]|nr:hypothetical protein KY285_000855 [Solanum tuberosum]